MSQFWRGRRVLITGGGGFLGAWLSRLLLEEGAEVWSYDVSPSVCLKVHGLADRVTVIQASVMDGERLEEALKLHGIEVCFHLAGQSMIEGAAEDITSTFDINIRGTWTVLEACRRAGGLRGIVCASSNHIYGSSQSLVTEDHLLNQLDAYGASKACADIVARAFGRNVGLPVVAARNVNSFGPGDFHTSHIVTGTILALLAGQAPVIRSDGSPVKAYLHARDTMDAYLRLAEHAQEPGVRGEAFNIAPASPISTLALVKTIVAVSGRQELEPVVLGVDRSQQGYYEHLSGEKLKQRLAWSPSMTLEEGLLDTYRWYAEHGRSWMEPEAYAAH